MFAGLFIHEVAYLVGIGMVAFAFIAIARVRSAASRRASLVKSVSMLPIYAPGYAFAVVLARFAAAR
jgi:hypothetical protein